MVANSPSIANGKCAISDLEAAKALARRHGLFVVARQCGTAHTKYLLFRAQPHQNVCIGSRSSLDALRRLIARAAGIPSSRSQQ